MKIRGKKRRQLVLSAPVRTNESNSAFVKKTQITRFNVYFERRQNKLTDYNTAVNAGTKVTWEQRLKNLEESIRLQRVTNFAQYPGKTRAAYNRKYQKEYVHFQGGDIVIVCYQSEINKMKALYSGPYKKLSREGNGCLVCNFDGSKASEYSNSASDKIIGLIKKDKLCENSLATDQYYQSRRYNDFYKANDLLSILA
ncbi:hypothetical protein SARC_12963, partial [Sphaeroforma arctica JP610]